MSDRKIAATFFPNWYAGTQYRREMTLQEYAAVILAATAATKEQLEWMKFGLFSNKKTPKGSLRHDANMTGITGIEVDLDRETLGFDEVVDIIEKAGLEALIYTSPSHLLNGHGPRLRVLCPTSKQLKPAARDHLICRAAGLFRDGPETLISGIVHAQPILLFRQGRQ